MWAGVLLYSLALEAIVCGAIGCIAAGIQISGSKTRRQILLCLLFPVGGVLYAVIVGFTIQALQSALLAVAYTSVPTFMWGWELLLWGILQGFLFMLLSAGAFRAVV